MTDRELGEAILAQIASALDMDERFPVDLQLITEAAQRLIKGDK